MSVNGIEPPTFWKSRRQDISILTVTKAGVRCATSLRCLLWMNTKLEK